MDWLCPRCRLLQEEKVCSACGLATSRQDSLPRSLARVPTKTELTRKIGLLRFVGAIASFLIMLVLVLRVAMAYGPVWIGVLGLVGAFVTMVPFLRFRGPELLLLPARRWAEPSAHHFSGKVEQFREIFDGGKVLSAEFVALGGSLLLRTQRETEFVLRDNVGNEILVAGVVILGESDSDGELAVPSMSLKQWGALIADEAQLRSGAVGVGDDVVVSSATPPRQEQVAGGYRDRKMLVLRGDSEQPLRISRR